MWSWRERQQQWLSSPPSPLLPLAAAAADVALHYWKPRSAVAAGLQGWLSPPVGCQLWTQQSNSVDAEVHLYADKSKEHHLQR